MTEALAFPGGWPEPPAAASGPVPGAYRGVWSRTLLETPDRRDDTTFVRWMQLGRWHVDLRVPVSTTDAMQGFSGITKVTRMPQGEVCTWQRLVDYQPPRPTVDEGWMVFETPVRVIETGIHGVYHEVWDRLPGSVGAQMALTEPVRADGRPSARIFVSGGFLMRVRPAPPGDAAFEISFGHLVDGGFQVEQSTLRGMAGQHVPLSWARVGLDAADVMEGARPSRWQILEWTDA